MQTWDAIRARRNVRQYTDRPIAPAGRWQRWCTGTAGSVTRMSDAPPVRPGMLLLELVPVPVTDIDRAKAFYSEQLGFHVDVDVRPADGVRVVQLTPPGSACPINLT